MPRSHDREELERFKRDINLTEYAAHLGYAMDRRVSSRHSIAMRRSSDNDKVIVTRNHNGHWIYFSVRDDHDSGSIIDFHQHRSGDNLGATRKALREFIGLEASHRPTVIAYAHTVEPTPPRNQDTLNNELGHAPPLSSHAYLQTDRAIGKDVLSAPRFTGQVRGDLRGNVLFPHFDESGSYSGSEMKNREFTGFSPGGEKALWISNTMQTDTHLVVCESGIDCLSHYTLFWRDHTDVGQRTRYVSTGGAWSPKTPVMLKRAIEHHPGRFIILSFDNDAQGREYTDDAQALLGELTNKRGMELRVRIPAHRKDWNEQLVNERGKVSYQER